MGCWVVILNFIQILKVLSVSNSAEPDQMPRFAASDLDLHCLPVSHEKDARLKWVKTSMHSYRVGLQG